MLTPRKHLVNINVALLFARCAKQLTGRNFLNFPMDGLEPDTKPMLDQFNKRLPKDITDKKSLLRELWLAVFAVVMLMKANRRTPKSSRN